MHLTRGDSRAQRPDLHHVRRALMGEHQAGSPVLRPPLSGHSREVHEWGQVIKASMAQ
jgi:hypothetical protein